MSYTEIRHREGLPYGGLPYDALLAKMEETDQYVVDGVRRYDEFHDLEDDYKDYVRSEIVDWTPDPPYLESDHPRRDPALSRSILNLHYNGTRGSRPELPRHPDLFYGFTGNDPRGSVNDPRFDVMRGHISSRAANLAVRMGNNDDHHLAERPWTNQSISYGMQEVNRRLKHNTRIFTVQKEGRPWGRNVVADAFAEGDVRAMAMTAAGETLDPPAHRTRFVSGDHNPANNASSDGVRGVDGGHQGRAEIAPWRHTTGDADLGVQTYTQDRGAGRSVIGPGARVAMSAPDQDWTESRRSRGTNRQVLGANMALAARYHRALKSGRPDQIPGHAYEVGAVPGSGLVASADVARLHRAQREEQTRQDSDGGALGPSAGLTPPENFLRPSGAETTPNTYLTNAETVAIGLREGRHNIAGQIVSDSIRAEAEHEAATRRGAVPASDNGRVTHMSDALLQGAAAAKDLEVHVYRAAVPPRPEESVAHGRDAYDTDTWRSHHEAPPIGRSRKGGEWRSATQGQTTLGDSPERVFGPDAEVATPGASAAGPKSLRSNSWDNPENLSDPIGA